MCIYKLRIESRRVLVPVFRRRNCSGRCPWILCQGPAMLHTVVDSKAVACQLWACGVYI